MFYSYTAGKKAGRLRFFLSEKSATFDSITVWVTSQCNINVQLPKVPKIFNLS